MRITKKHLEVSGVGDHRLAVRVRVPRLLVHAHPAGPDQGLQQSSGIGHNLAKYASCATQDDGSAGRNITVSNLGPNTGWTEDRRNSNMPLFSGMVWAMGLIFGVFKVQIGRFNYMYRTSGLTPICIV